MIRYSALVLFALLCLPMLVNAAEPATQYYFEFVDSIRLPDLVVDGLSAKVHTQGLFVTDTHYLVTGRLDTEPKRALLMRFSLDRSSVEYLDITPARTTGDALLDHPGGFDRDARGCFQIPVSTSNRRGPTVIQGYRIVPDQPLSQAKLESSVPINDHLGAICCLDETLIGANWDTLTIYFIREGKIQKQIRQAETLSRGNPHVAVQDWKSWTAGNAQTLTILGGLVKGQTPSAVIQIANLFSGEVMATQRLAARDDVSRPLTNEGLAVHKGMLYLLPEDIGRGAKLLRYKIVASQTQTN